MARIRSIKPEFWTSLDVARLSRDARLLFIGLWNHVDDAGRAVADPRLVKSAVFPLDDDLDSTNVRRLLDELSRGGQIVLYQADGRPLLQVTGWHHQKIDRPQASRLPAPPDATADQHEQSFDEDSTNDRRCVDEGSSLDQGSGIRDQGSSLVGVAPPPSPEDPKQLVAEYLGDGSTAYTWATEIVATAKREALDAIALATMVRVLFGLANAPDPTRWTKSGKNPPVVTAAARILAVGATEAEARTKFEWWGSTRTLQYGGWKRFADDWPTITRPAPKPAQSSAASRQADRIANLAERVEASRRARPVPALPGGAA